MPHNYELAAIQQLHRNNELLALLCELMIAQLDNDVHASDCRHRLERIVGKDTISDGFSVIEFGKWKQ